MKQLFENQMRTQNNILKLPFFDREQREKDRRENYQ